jgi:superfamily II RNA helicase
MTTEILLNKLYQIKSKNKITNSTCSFEMDIENELGCVVFDEVHMIGDENRGHVWENSIIMLPPYVQMVMLSATLDSPEKFALWVETKGNPAAIVDKSVYLTCKYNRSVPLTHYSFITCTSGLFKILKNKELEMEIMKTTNKLHTIQDAKGVFNDDNYNKIIKTLAVFDKFNHRVKRQHTLNEICKHMVFNNMLPALCFIFSRKMIEKCAKEITTNLLEDDSKVPYIIKNECEKIIRKLPNYKEYLELPEYINMVSLLEKGIGIHHAGIMAPLREIVELLFAKGYIKLLFSTETMCIGINMPVKTTIFTDINKFDGKAFRMLHSHEYVQASGRAGRLGIDTVGHVIHLTNLFKSKELYEVKNMMKGLPQKLVSKFKTSYNLILNLIDISENDFSQYTKKSMNQETIDNQVKLYYDKAIHLQTEIDNIKTVSQYTKTPIKVIEEYIDLTDKKKFSVNKKRKEIERGLQNIKEQYFSIEKDVEKFTNLNNKEQELKLTNNLLTSTESTMDTNIQCVLDILLQNDFIEKNVLDDNNTIYYTLLIKGQIATYLKEVHCLIFADIIINNKLKNFEAKEIVGILSCFTNISVSEEYKTLNPESKCENIKSLIIDIHESYKQHNELEIQSNINTGIDYNMQFNIIDYCIEWCECADDISCKNLLQKISQEKEIFLGEFVKAILKINNISLEMEKIAEFLGDIEMLNNLKKIPELTLKYVATNQSLYV